MCVCVISLCVFGLWPMLCYTWSTLFRPRRDGLRLEWSAWVACDFPCLWLVWCIKTVKRLADCSGFHWSGAIIRCLVGQHYLKWLFFPEANYRWYWDRFFFCASCAGWSEDSTTASPTICSFAKLKREARCSLSSRCSAWRPAIRGHAQRKTTTQRLSNITHRIHVCYIW